MSRSIHTTRRDVSREQAPQRRAQLREHLQRKREIKCGTLASRRTATASLSSPQIVIKDDGPFVHYPATATDIENVIARLPRDLLDGVATIELSLGLGDQRRDEDGYQPDPDPLTGRRGFERLPGVYSGQTLGRYIPSTNRIQVFGFVSAARPAAHWELYLRLHMLSTFLHEIGHHADNMRSARGRGRGEGQEDNEIFAEQRQHEWTWRHAVPYLEETYPEAVAALLAWIKEHGGCRLPLGALAGGTRTIRGGFISLDGVFGGVPSAVEHLAENVLKGEVRRETRLSFARELHYTELYSTAIAIVEHVLAEYPDDSEALTLKADCFEHLERYNEAEAILRGVLAREPNFRDAWFILGLTLEDQERWAELLVASEHALALAENARQATREREFRATALIKLGRKEEALAEIGTLERDRASWSVRRLRKLLVEASEARS